MKKKQRREEEEEEDRISLLPQPLLHQILCHLSQKEALQTCVLSKSWRDLGPTRPKIELGEDFFNGRDVEIILSKTLQRYHDQNLSIQEFIISGMRECSKLFSLLENWIPIVLLNMGVNKFHLSIVSSYGKLEPGNFRMPWKLLKAESLKELYLKSCQINSLVQKVLCTHLRKLSLSVVLIKDATLEKILSSCPFIEDLELFFCEGLETIKLSKAHNLKVFKFYASRGRCRSIEIDDAHKSIESISIKNCPNWIHDPNIYFPSLKSLSLYKVRLSNESIDDFLINLPCLEKLSLSFIFSCSEQFQISSRSIKDLTIAVEGSSFKSAIIDATNILSFDFSCKFLPSISFTTTSTEWKSIIRVRSAMDFNNDASSWLCRLSEIFKALSTSQISLHINGIPKVVPDTCGRSLCDQPFVIENLSIKGNRYSSVPGFLNCLFRNFRTRNIQQVWWDDRYPFSRYKERENRVIELLCKTLLLESVRAHCFGQQNLEDVKMEASYENEEEWRGVEGTSSLSEFVLPWNSLKIRFRLNWRRE